MRGARQYRPHHHLAPPYNVEVVYGTHRNDLSYAEYLGFCETWLKRCYEWLKLDPFAGSGTTLLAAVMHERRAIGIEIEARYCELARQRIEAYLSSRQLALQIQEEPVAYEAT